MYPEINNITYWQKVLENAKTENEKKIALKRIAKLQNSDNESLKIVNNHNEIGKNRNSVVELDSDAVHSEFQELYFKLEKYERLYKNTKDVDVFDEIQIIKKEIADKELFIAGCLNQTKTGVSKRFNESFVWNMTAGSVRFLKNALYNEQELAVLAESSEWISKMVHQAKTLFGGSLVANLEFKEVPDYVN